MSERLRVLLVEDSEDDAALILRELRRSELAPSIVRVETREAFLAALAREPWDLVVTDYSLPSYDGLRAVRDARAAGIDVPIIIVSGSIGEEMAVETMKAGADDYVLKTRLARLPAAIAREIGEAKIRKVRLEAAGRLARSQQAFRNLIDWAPEGIGVYRPGGLVYANASLAACLGYARPEDLTGLDPLAIVSPEQRALLEARLGATFETREQEAPREYGAVRRDGATIALELTVGFTEDFDGLPALVVFARDVTERRKMQTQLLVSERMASMGTLAAGVAHEINNPLAVSLANLDIVSTDLDELVAELRASGGGPTMTRLAELGEPLRDAREGADRVRLIVRDLKVFSRCDEELREPVDLRRVLDSSIRMAWNELRHRSRVLREYGDLTPVMGNEARLGQVFLNLLVNAAQAMPEGNADQNTIRISGRHGLGEVVVEVQDSGGGIAPEVLRNIFDPFFTTKPIGVGTGLGLAICHRIISELGGRIGVESEVGRGTTFRVTLPEAPSLESAPAAEVTPEGPAARGRVLVVDDELNVGKTIGRILDKAHDVTVLTEAREALAGILAGERYDVVLCDLMMPRMTGMDLHGAVASVAPEQAARMIFLTGGAFTVGARAFVERVPNELLEKPFDAQTLLRMVDARVRAGGRPA